jgi:hypothetical protein
MEASVSSFHTDPIDLLTDSTEVGNLNDATIQWLLRNGVNTSAIAGPWAVHASWINFKQPEPRYCPNPIGEFALIVPVVGTGISNSLCDLDAADLIAWSPKSGRIGTRLGRAFALGEDQIGVDGFGTTGLALPVHRTPLGWLRESRRGMVIADWELAAYALRDLILSAQDEAHRGELTSRLTPRGPRIVISSRESRRVA